MLFRHVEHTSFMHQLNPVVKFAAILVAVIVLMLVFDPLPTAFMLALAVGMAVGLARISPRRVVRSMAPFAGLAVGLAWINIVFPREAADPLWEWAFLRVTPQSLRVGLTLGLRVLTIVAFSYLFAATTDPRDLALSMVHQLHVPYRLAFGLFAGFRFLPLLQSEFEHIRAAHRVRGAGWQQGWRAHTAEAWRLALPLFAVVIRKAAQIGLAMESRAFGARAERTYLHETRVTRQDVLFLVGLVTLLALALWWFDHMGWITRFGLQVGTPYQRLVE
ncbi:MAG: energy-coupling factor transporter transmembrane component T [Ardenticatenia bacterium]|nr:energy-coupling factor transporter transmembrane component T [Ardenticatenia bacterium]